MDYRLTMSTTGAAAKGWMRGNDPRRAEVFCAVSHTDRCRDLEMDKPRQFRLDRIEWVDASRRQFQKASAQPEAPTLRD